MKERGIRPPEFVALVLSLLPLPGKVQDFRGIIRRLEAFQGQDVEIERFVSGEADVRFVHGHQYSSYAIRDIEGSLRLKTTEQFDDMGVKRYEYYYREGVLAEKEVFENEKKSYKDEYIYPVDFRIDNPPTMIPVFEVTRTYSDERTPDHWTLEKILTDYFPHSWAGQVFRATIKDLFTPNTQSPEYNPESRFDANDIKVKVGQEIERFVTLPILPPGKRIKATLRVERFDPSKFDVKLSLLRTELVGWF